MNPGPFTLRELATMSEARRRDEWSRTSELLALLYNINRDPKAPPKQSHEISPFGKTTFFDD